MCSNRVISKSFKLQAHQLQNFNVGIDNRDESK